MRVYSAGAHTIAPSDYDYQPSIVVELWSAGGSSCSYYCSLSQQIPARGSGSGAYIKAQIDTSFRPTLSAIVGRSADGSSLPCQSGLSGLYGGNINITISAGNGLSPPSCNSTEGGQIVSLAGTSDVLFQTGMNGAADGYGSYPAPTCSGGSAPRGGSGGCCGISYSPPLNCPSRNVANGTTPGGGGGASYARCPSCPLIIGVGGDGALIIYY